jgi:hypothetical protein
VKVLFTESDLTPILAKIASARLNCTISPSDISNFDYEEDDEGDIKGVSFEFELPAEPAAL